MGHGCSIPIPRCRHEMRAYVDLDVGKLDEQHIFCPGCGEVVCFTMIDPIHLYGRCSSCGLFVQETQQKLEDGIGRVQYIKFDEAGRAVSGGQI